MSKKNRLYKKRPNAIEKIYKIARSSRDDNHKRDAQNMIDFYIRNGFIPRRMQSRVADLINLNKGICSPEEKIPINQRHYLYAVSDGDNLKIGYSVNPESRLKRMQTGNSKDLKVVWESYCASDSKEAQFQEKKLHRHIRNYKIRGEWFEGQCINLLESWVVKNNSVKMDEEELEIISSIPECF